MLAVDLIGVQVDPSTGASVLVLREHDAPNRLLPIVELDEDEIDAEVADSPPDVDESDGTTTDD